MKKIAHRRRKRGRWVGFIPPLFIVRGQTHFCRIINNFLLFNHGQLIVIRTILQNSSQHWGVCDQTMYKFSWIMTFFFYPHSLPPPNPNWRLYYVVFVVGAIYLVQNVLSLFPILHYLNTWNAKMLSASYRKRQRPPFIAYYYYYYYFCGGGGGGNGMSIKDCWRWKYVLKKRFQFCSDKSIYNISELTIVLVL